MGARDDRLFTPAFVALTISDLAYFTAAGVIIFATPFFVVGPLEASTATVGPVMGAFSVTTLVLRPWVGRTADRRGRRTLLVAGAFGFAVVIAAHSLVTSVAMLVALRLLLGAAEALFFVAGFAALADLAPPGRAGEALSFNSLALYLGVALGPLLGERLVNGWGFTGAWVGATALAVLAGLLALRVPETLEGRSDTREPLISRAALGPSLGLFAGVAGMAVFLAYAPLHAENIGIETVSSVLLVFGVIVVVCRVALARIPDRVDPARLIRLALVVSGAGLVVTSVARNVATLLAAAALLAVGVAFLTPAVFAAIFRAVPASERGTAAGTASLFIDLGLGGGQFGAGLVVNLASIPVAFVAGAAVAVMAGAWAGRLVPRVSAGLAGDGDT